MRSGTLFVVATPIGNLEDITLRALRILREVDLVAAEDTRRTGNLLRHYNIATPTLSVHEHNEGARVEQLLAHLGAGKSVALVSDAGTPAISDPGALIVQAARTAGIPVVPIPGPSAVAAAISVAGIHDAPFAFLGFPPIRSKARIQWLRWLADQRETAVAFFEAPHRVMRTLNDLCDLLGTRPILVGREVSKIHEEWRTGTAGELASYFSDPQGEFIFVALPWQGEKPSQDKPSDAEISFVFGEMTNNSDLDRRAAIRTVAERLHLSPSEVYRALERIKASANRPT